VRIPTSRSLASRSSYWIGDGCDISSVGWVRVTRSEDAEDLRQPNPHRIGRFPADKQLGRWACKQITVLIFVRVVSMFKAAVMSMSSAAAEPNPPPIKPPPVRSAPGGW
jgi:hypothetical protein